MEAGILSKMRGLSYDDVLILVKMLKPYRETLNLMLNYFKSEDDFIKFLDLFAGANIHIPPRSRLYHVIENIQVYRYYQNHLHNEDALHITARRFNMTTQRVKAIIQRVNERISE